MEEGENSPPVRVSHGQVVVPQLGECRNVKVTHSPTLENASSQGQFSFNYDPNGSDSDQHVNDVTDPDKLPGSKEAREAETRSKKSFFYYGIKDRAKICAPLEHIDVRNTLPPKPKAREQADELIITSTSTSSPEAAVGTTSHVNEDDSNLAKKKSQGEESHVDKGAVMEEYRQRRLKNAREYLRQSMLAHLFILTFAVGFEILFLVLCCMAGSDSPHAELRFQAVNLQAAQARLQEVLAQAPRNESAVMSANSDLDREVMDFRAVLVKTEEHGRLLFMYEGLFTGASLLSICVLAVAVYNHRNHPVVKSRGRIYLILMFTISILLILSSLLMAASNAWQLNQFPLDLDYRNPVTLDRQIEISAVFVFVSFSITVALVAMYFSVIALRQRMIAHAYSTKLSPLTNKHLVLWAGGWALIALSCTIPGYIYWFVALACHPEGTRFVVFWPMGIGVVYVPLISVYLYRARHASLKFNDMFSNIRAIVVIMVALLAVVCFTYIKPYHTISACVGWTSITRLVVSVQVLDQFSTQLLQARWEIPARPPALNDITTSINPAGWFRWTSHIEPNRV